MSKTKIYHLAVLLTIASLSLGATVPALAQLYPAAEVSHEDPNNGTVPPSTGNFVRQDPMPESLSDITIYSSDHKGIELEITFPDFFDYEFAQEAEFKIFRRYKAKDGFKILGNIGEPEILHRIVWLQIPADAENIKIDVAHQTVKGDLNENMFLCPIPEVVFESKPEGAVVPTEKFSINKEFYQKDSFFPEYSARLFDEGYKRNVRFIKVAVPVMFYNPKTSQTQDLRGLRLKVSYESKMDENAVPVDTQNDPFHAILNLTFPNYSYVSHSSPNKDGGVVEIRGDDLTNPEWASQNIFFPDYLVIAAQRFDNPQSVLKTVWADHRAYGETGGNHKIAVAYAHEIYDAYPGPALKEEKIKEFIKMVYQRWRLFENQPSLIYILLVGDADMYQYPQLWFFPTWRSNPDSLDTGDCDYSLLSGDDFESDVFLGRLPAKNEDQLATLVNKIVQLENNPPQGENHYGTRLMMLNHIFGSLHLDEPAACAMRQMLISRKKELLEYNNVYLPRYDLFKFDSAVVTNDLNETGSLFVSYTGHGWYQNWWPEPVDVLDLTNSQTLPVVILSAACQTAGFDQPDQDVFGEKWIKHVEGGAVSFFGAMRETSLNDHPYHFVQAVYKELVPPLLGAAIDYSKKDFSETMLLAHVLLGDPALYFGAYLGQSTKTDLSVESTILDPSFPTYRGQPMTVNVRIKNRSAQNAYNIPVKLFSVESGSFNLAHPALAEWTIGFLPPQGVATKAIPLTYQGESSRLFITMIDPDGTKGELSKFNNWLNYELKYFPVYVDQKNTSGIEHGTYDKPFRNLADAVNHAMDHDLVGNNYIHQGIGPVEVHLRKGYYGSGDVIGAKSIYLKGLDGAKKTVVFDSLDVTGTILKVEDLTFDGRKQSAGSAVMSKPGDEIFANHENTFLRNIFKDWHGNTAVHLQRANSNGGYPWPFQSSWIFQNNIFYDNFSSIRVLDAEGEIQNNFVSTNNTFFNNQNNLNLNSIGKLFIRLKNNIFWEAGETAIEGLLNGNSIIYNNMDDPKLWEITGNPDHNIQEDPKFRNTASGNFNLSAGSPSIDSGDPDVGSNDPDGTPNDQGAHGGPESIFPGIRITKPIDGSTLFVEEQGPIPLNIEWCAYKLNQSNYIRIYLYHMEYEPAAPDRSNLNQSYQSGKRVIDLDFEFPDFGAISLELEQLQLDTSYFLTISDPYVHLGDYDTINFKVMEKPASLIENR